MTCRLAMKKTLSHDTYFAKNIIVYYSGIMDRFNFINFMDSYNLNVSLLTKTATYHIYLEDRCIFKNLNEEEFDLIWDKIYRSYWKDDLTYSVGSFGDHISDLEPSF